MELDKLYVNTTKGRGGDNRDRIKEGVFVFRAYVEPFEGASKLTFTMRTNHEIMLYKFVEGVGDWLRKNDYWCPFASALTVHYNSKDTSGHSKLILYIPEDVITDWLWDYIQFGQPNIGRR